MNEIDKVDLEQMDTHNNNYGNRTTSNGVIPVVPNPSNRFTGRTEVIAEPRRHFSNARVSAFNGTDGCTVDGDVLISVSSIIMM